MDIKKNNLKFYALYLPQFHQIPENDEWWGEGFTEWTNVKSAKSQSKIKKYLRTPKNNFYYDLMNKDTVLWQSELMKNYGVDGLVYYHYYFKGKLLLQKPAENILKWKDINQNFFFCWANHDWNRSWDGTRELLVRQEYGEKDDWEKHFQYLLPFFKDDRYSKVDNKPMFMVFKSDIPKKEEMFIYFEKRCKECGFNGLYLIETFWSAHKNIDWENDYQIFKKQCSSVTERIFLREFSTSQQIYFYSRKRDLLNKIYRKLRRMIGEMTGEKYICKYNGNKFVSIMEKEEAVDGMAMRGLCFEWNNTPRHKERGTIVSAPSKDRIMHYLDSIKNSDYVIINAWNEWAEGMILEPTEETGYRYLEWIREWKKKKKK